EVGESDGVSDGVSSHMNDLHKDGGMSDMNKSELIFGSIGKESVMSNNSNVGVKSKVVNDFPFAGNVSINKNVLGSSSSGVVPEMPVPLPEDAMLCSKSNVEKKVGGGESVKNNRAAGNLSLTHSEWRYSGAEGIWVIRDRGGVNNKGRNNVVDVGVKESSAKYVPVKINLHNRIVQLNVNLHVNARANTLRLVKETDEATGVKSNSNLYTKFYDQSCREDLIKVEELQRKEKG
ncbi:hypothetical protein Tco_0676635, partial [Tanacetum coccineum]